MLVAAASGLVVQLLDGLHFLFCRCRRAADPVHERIVGFLRVLDVVGCPAYRSSARNCLNNCHISISSFWFFVIRR